MRTTIESREALLAGLRDKRKRLADLQTRRSHALKNMKLELKAGSADLEKIDRSIENIKRALRADDYNAHDQVAGE